MVPRNPHPDRTPLRRWAKLRLWAGYIFILSAVIFAQPQLPWMIAGCILILLGSLVRIIASATLVKDLFLCQSGIYASTRNPLYLGSFLVALGFAALTSSLWFPAAVLFILLPLYIRMIALEEKYLLALFPDAFSAYLKTVPKFFPRRIPPSNLTGTLDATRLKNSRELASTAMFIILAIILLTWHRSWLPA